MSSSKDQRSINDMSFPMKEAKKFTKGKLIGSKLKNLRRSHRARATKLAKQHPSSCWLEATKQNGRYEKSIAYFFTD
jgi:hypothetical protein